MFNRYYHRFRKLFLPILVVAYPFLAHFSVVSNDWLPIVLVLLFGLVVIWLIDAIHAGKKLFILALIVITVGFILLILRGESLQILYIPPLLINVAFFLLFANSLRQQKIPLITRFATLVRGKIEPQIADYTRRVTQWWAYFFLVIIVETIALTLYAPLTIWSLFTNFLNYLFIALFFVIEYQIRIRWLSDVKHHSFLKMLRSISKVDIRRVI